MTYKIGCIIGTRPEVIKMAPLIMALKQQPQLLINVINTAQHRKLLDDMLSIFNLTPDIDCNIMQPDQSLGELTGRLCLAINTLFHKHAFDLIVAQGDTTTTFIAALIAFYQHIPFAHIEAGLRSYDLDHPFPEEANRVLISKLSSLHFSPTQLETLNLQSEKIPTSTILTCGNTVIDALLQLCARPDKISFPLDKTKRILLVTLHRRENFGEPQRRIFHAFIELAEKFTDIEIIYPVHPNPAVYDAAHAILGKVPRIRLIDPIPYDEFVTLMKNTYLILTDSGGIQEEAPALNIPLLILRDITERPLVVTEGAALLVGSDTEKIVEAASKMLTDKAFYQQFQKGKSPYGDGHASERIVKFIMEFLTRRNKT
jgi:UDP-N-acetylglucosamine 2-epimerase (non-hydrolysing)